MSLLRWEYKICDCKVKVTDDGGLFGGPEGFWVLLIDEEEVELTKALANLGNKGWELAGIQTVSTELYHNRITEDQFPESFYVFKRSLGSI